MKKSALALLLLLLSGAVSLAQSATFTWNGNDYGTELATINGVPVNQSTGYAGSIEVVNGYELWLLTLPESLDFPNNGYLDCQTIISWGADQWGTRANGTTMDGTQAGDYYTKSGDTNCPLWNGTTMIALTEFHEFIAHRSCGHGICHTYLLDTIENGYGSAVVEG